MANLALNFETLSGNGTNAEAMIAEPTYTIKDCLDYHLNMGSGSSEPIPGLIYGNLLLRMPWADAIRNNPNLSDECRNAADVLFQGPNSDSFAAMFGIRLSIISTKPEYKEMDKKVEYMSANLRQNFLYYLRTVFDGKEYDHERINAARAHFTKLGLDMNPAIIEEISHYSDEIAQAALESVEYWNQLIGSRTQEFFDLLREEGVENIPQTALSPMEIYPDPSISTFNAGFLPEETGLLAYLLVGEENYDQIEDLMDYTSRWLEFIYATPVAEKYIPKYDMPKKN